MSDTENAEKIFGELGKITKKAFREYKTHKNQVIHAVKGIEHFMFDNGMSDIVYNARAVSALTFCNAMKNDEEIEKKMIYLLYLSSYIYLIGKKYSNVPTSHNKIFQDYFSRITSGDRGITVILSKSCMHYMDHRDYGPIISLHMPIALSESIVNGVYPPKNFKTGGESYRILGFYSSDIADRLSNAYGYSRFIRISKLVEQVKNRIDRNLIKHIMPSNILYNDGIFLFLIIPDREDIFGEVVDEVLGVYGDVTDNPPVNHYVIVGGGDLNNRSGEEFLKLYNRIYHSDNDNASENFCSVCSLPSKNNVCKVCENLINNRKYIVEDNKKGKLNEDLSHASKSIKRIISEDRTTVYTEIFYSKNFADVFSYLNMLNDGDNASPDMFVTLRYDNKKAGSFPDRYDLISRTLPFMSCLQKGKKLFKASTNQEYDLLRIPELSGKNSMVIEFNISFKGPFIIPEKITGNYFRNILREEAEYLGQDIHMSDTRVIVSSRGEKEISLFIITSPVEGIFELYRAVGDSLEHRGIGKRKSEGFGNVVIDVRVRYEKGS